MVLMNVDLPQPLGPRMATCSPAWMRRVMLWRTVFSPRITEMLVKWSSGGWELVVGGWVSAVSVISVSIFREYTASMLKHTVVSGLLMTSSLLFGQLDSNSVTVSANQNTNLQPDQVVFGIYVTSGINSSLDDVLAALKTSGITIANFSGVSSNGTQVGTGLPQQAIQWV